MTNDRSCATCGVALEPDAPEGSICVACAQAAARGLSDDFTPTVAADAAMPATSTNSSSIRANAQPLLERIGDFEVLDKLGQGGMGAVYRARQVSLDRLVALKILPSQFVEEESFVGRFRREATVAASLNHPNLVRVYSSGEADGVHFIAMELVEGENLRQFLRRVGPMAPLDALRTAVQVARGLQHGWQKAQLIHRDIKPSNIYLSQSGDVKVGDLGLAKSLSGNTTGITHTGTALGTPHYVSPEQARGDKVIDCRADIYSLGCTLYEMLTGSTPYRGSDPVSVMHSHLHSPPPAILKVLPQCPVPIARIVSKMLQKKPHERHQGYDELVAAMESAIDQLENPNTGPSAVVQAWKEIGRAEQSLLPARVTAAKPAVSPSTPKMRDTSISAAPANARKPVLLWGGIAAAAAMGAIAFFVMQNGRTELSSHGPDGAPAKRPGDEPIPLSSVPAAEVLKPAGPSSAASAAQWEHFEFAKMPAKEVLQNRRHAEMRGDLLHAEQNDGWAYRGRHIQNAAIGATAAWAGVGSGPKFKLIFRENTGGPFAHCFASFWPEVVRLGVLHSGDGKPIEWLRDIKHDLAANPPREVTFTAALVGSRMTVWLNGESLGSVEGFPLTPTGKVGIQAEAADFRSVDVLPLDGLPETEALKLAGVGASAAPALRPPASGTAASRGWTDWKAEQERKKNVPRNMTVEGEMWVSGSGAMVLDTARNAAGRVRFDWSKADQKEVQFQFRYSEKARYEVITRKNKEDEHFRIQFTRYEGTILVRNESVDIPAAISPTGELLFEARAVGEDFTASLNGQQIASFNDSGLRERGSLVLKAAKGTRLFSVEAMNLDDAARPAGTSTPASATKDAPFVNSLGMKFVPVPITGGPTGGQRVLFSIWETRMQDYEAFVKETKRDWPKTGFPQEPTHPVVNVLWSDAAAFCEWLTDRERKAGKLAATEAYRLPSDHEWSCAVDLGKREDANATVNEKNSRIPNHFGWGESWPPPPNAGNFSGEELQAEAGKGVRTTIPGYRDAFARTAPVGSFPANALGLHDLAGNAREWCLEPIKDHPELGALRGSGWNDAEMERFLSSCRQVHELEKRNPANGFRVVLAPEQK